MKQAGIYYYAVVILFLTGVYNNAFAQCDPTFTYQSEGPTTFNFTANQVEQPGFTYYQHWTFSSGNFSAQPSVLNYFPGPGTYQVCHSVIIQDSAGVTICADSTCQTIQITITPTCFPDSNIYYVMDDSVHATFTDALTNYSNVSIRWVFGDGTTLSGVASPTHTYPHPGNYEACLYLRDTVRNCGDTLCTYVSLYTPVVNHYCGLETDFSTRQPSFSSDSVVITDNTVGTYQITIWNFGDGTIDSFPQTWHKYPHYGVNYIACLTHIDTTQAACSSQSCVPVYIDTCNSNAAHFLSNEGYSVLDIQFMTTLQYDFYNNSQYAYWIWTFGDQTIDTSHSEPSHVYSAPGSYPVCLTVHAPGCPSEYSCDTVTVTCNLTAGFYAVQVAPLGITYTPSSNSLNATYKWTFGDSSESNEINPTHVYQHYGSFTACLIVYDIASGCRDTFCNSVTVVPWSDTICGYSFVDLNGNGIWDTLEPPVQSTVILINAGGYQFQVSTDSSGFYEAIVPAGTNITLTYDYGGTYVNTIPFLINTYTLNSGLPNTRQCGFNFGVIINTATVAGTVYADTNNNGIFDNGEPGVPNQVVHINGQAVVTDSKGNYQAITALSPTTVWKDSSGFFGNFATVPPQINVHPLLPGIQYPGNNFGIQIPAAYADIAVDIIPLTPVDPVTYASYMYLVANLSPGFAYFAGTFTADTSLFLYNGQYDSYNQTTNTAFWSGSLNGFQTQSSFLDYLVDPSVVINQDIYNTGQVTLINATDQNPQNNTDTCHQIVVASFDPNEKMSNQAGQGPEGFISNDQELKYVISFENTGTAPAVNIVVSDVLDPSLNPRSFRFINSSDPCDVRILGDTIYFRFSDIMLRPLSYGYNTQGWASFAITPKRGLAPLTPIRNSAAVYFDLNAPVITDTTLHTIDSVAKAMPPAPGNTAQLIIMPNPFDDQTTIRISDTTGATYQYKMNDMMGRTVQKGEITSNTSTVLSRQELSSGTYVIAFYNGETVIKAKVVIQ